MEDEDDSDACGLWSTVVFLVGLIAGTACTVLSKALFQTEAIGLSGELEPFRPSLFQTWIMFLSMSFALPIHLMSEARRRRLARGKPAEMQQINQEQARLSQLRQLLPLTVPAIFDLISTLLMILGLMYINASVWMLLRGAGVVFVALMKNFFLDDALRPNMWVGVFTIACGVVLVGLSSNVGLNLSDGQIAARQSTTGVTLTLLGTFVQSLQYTYEEKVLSLDIVAPPWMLIGLEGAFCTLLSTCVLYPLFSMMPGDDHGSFESPFNTVTQLRNSRLLVLLAVGYGVTVFVLNAFSVSRWSRGSEGEGRGDYNIGGGIQHFSTRSPSCETRDCWFSSPLATG
jgi:drug/metabolite transporter (DMT)-like permease